MHLDYVNTPVRPGGKVASWHDRSPESARRTRAATASRFSPSPFPAIDDSGAVHCHNGEEFEKHDIGTKTGATCVGVQRAMSRRSCEGRQGPCAGRSGGRIRALEEQTRRPASQHRGAASGALFAPLVRGSAL